MKRLDRAVFRARRGRLVGPVKTQNGYYVFTVDTDPTRVGDARPKEHRKLVRDHLRSEAEQAVAGHVRDASFTATWKARTVCAPAFDWVKDCSNWDGTEAQALAPSSARSSTPASRRPASSSCPSSRWLNESRISLCPSSPT